MLADFRVDQRILLITVLAVPVGIIAAIVAKVLLWLIALITNLAFFQQLSTLPAYPQLHHLGAVVVLVPMLGAVIIGLVARYGSEKIRGHGIPEALEAILLGRSFIEPKVAILKPITAAISIGTGGPFGAEGPIIMTGGAFGSLFAQTLALSAAERKTLLVAGAAGGMAAVFAAPVAAVLLAVELLLFEWRPRSLIPVVVASVVASILRVPLLGPGPLFPIAAHAALTNGELAFALLVGLISGLVSALMTALVYGCEDLFERLPIHWMWWPTAGALVVGIGGLIEPRILGVGYDTIAAILHGDIIGPAILVLLIVKAIAWSVALGSGTSGGVLAPLLMIGGATGTVMAHWLPTGDASLWAVIGMGAIMGGTMRSPLTGIVFMLELTHDWNALPGLLIGSVAALAVTVLLLRRSILTEKLARRGHHIAREYSVDPFELVRVGDVMDKNVPTIPATMPVTELADRISKVDPTVCAHQGVLLVDNSNQLAGIITRGDVVRALQAGGNAQLKTVLEAGTANPIVTYADELLYDAIAKMLKHDIGRLPVVEREQPQHAIGYLGRACILAAYHRRHEEEELRERGPLASLPYLKSLSASATPYE